MTSSIGSPHEIFPSGPWVESTEYGSSISAKPTPTPRNIKVGATPGRRPEPHPGDVRRPAK
jgi:hypothetical protein